MSPADALQAMRDRGYQVGLTDDGRLMVREPLNGLDTATRGKALAWLRDHHEGVRELLTGEQTPAVQLAISELGARLVGWRHEPERCAACGALAVVLIRFERFDGQGVTLLCVRCSEPDDGSQRTAGPLPTGQLGPNSEPNPQGGPNDWARGAIS